MSKLLSKLQFSALVAAALCVGCTQAPVPAAHSEASAASPSAVPAPVQPAPDPTALAGKSVPAIAAPSAVSGWRRQEIAVLPWGAGPNQAGRVAQGEQNLEAPMAFDGDGQGRVWLLDQVNQRILVLQVGQTTRVIPASRTAQDIAITASGQPWVLDRLVDRNVQLLDPVTGAVQKTLSLTEATITESGLSSALWQHAGKLWLEMENTYLIALDDLAHPKLMGRPSRDGKWLLSALRVPPDKVAVAGNAVGQSATEAPKLALQAEFPLPVWAIAELDSDASGRVWIVADLVKFGPDDRPVDRKRQAVAWKEDGKVAARLDLCAPVGAEEQFRTARVLADGTLLNLCRGPQGIVIERFAP
ncbi:MAG: hypothetical protein EXR77_02745 [Myxococcales bacterium]|nr:hypothetical protein [Myxococcales bacterium]